MRKIIIAAALLVAVLFSAAADLYDEDRPLQTIKTIWFDLVFPTESESAALYLAGFADDLYVKVSGLLGTAPRHRLPVIITPDHESINGYFTNYPYPRIVLYQAAIDSNSTLGNYQEDLRSLFMHELTHAVSLTIRGPVQETLVAIFGSPLGLSIYTTPLNFVEGVTVSFESLSGFGRTTDPLAGAMIRQDILEGKYKTFTQTMGPWDRYPGGRLYYIYGGYFSHYLQQRFGMPKYAELWKRLGSGMLTRPLDDFLFIQGHFRKVYGLSLSEAWADFGQSMEIGKPVLESGPLISGLSTIDSLAGGGAYLYWADRAEGAVFLYDTLEGQTKRLFSSGALITRLDVEDDGSRIMVSATHNENSYARLVIYEWDKSDASLNRLPYRGLRDASYLEAMEKPDKALISLLAIQTRGYTASLVLVQGGTISPLLEGGLNRSYASPLQGTDGWIYALVKEDGIVSVLRFRLEGRTVGDIQKLSLPEGLGRIRYLSMEKGILRFSWDDSAFYRLVEVEGDQLRYQSTPTSGGVHQAVGSSGSIYYLGYFSEGIAVCSYPSDTSGLGFQETKAVWVPAEELRTSAEPSSLKAVSRYGDSEPFVEFGTSRDKPYSSLPWLLPRFWHPVISGDADGLNLAGAAVYFADPIEKLSGYLSGGWNPKTQTPDFKTGVDIAMNPLLLRISLEDAFNSAASDAYPSKAVRQSSMGFTLGTSSLPFSGGRFDLGFSGAVQAWTESLNTSDRYEDWDLALAYTGVFAGWQDTKQVFSKPGLYKGYSLVGTVRCLAPVLPMPSNPRFGIEVQAMVASGFLGLQANSYAGLSFSEDLGYGPNGAVIQTDTLGVVSIQTYPLYEEFKDGSTGTWYMQSEVAIRAFSKELQQAAGPVYIRRLNLRTGFRASLTNGFNGFGEYSVADNSLFNWSIFSRLELDFTPALGALALTRPVAWVEFWYRPLDETWGLGYVRELSF